MSVLSSSSIRKAGNMFIVQERLYVDATRQTIVPENDPKAAFLLAPKGGEITLEEALRYGLVKPETKSEDPKAIAGRETRVPKNLATR